MSSIFYAYSHSFKYPLFNSSFMSAITSSQKWGSLNLCCLNTRAEGYQGEAVFHDAPGRSHKKCHDMASFIHITQTGLSMAPDKCAIAVSTVITRSRFSTKAAVSSHEGC